MIKNERVGHKKYAKCIFLKIDLITNDLITIFKIFPILYNKLNYIYNKLYNTLNYLYSNIFS